MEISIREMKLDEYKDIQSLSCQIFQSADFYIEATPTTGGLKHFAMQVLSGFLTSETYVLNELSYKFQLFIKSSYLATRCDRIYLWSRLGLLCG